MTWGTDLQRARPSLCLSKVEIGIVCRPLLDDCGVTSLFVGKSPRSFRMAPVLRKANGGEPIEEAITMANVQLVQSLYAAFARGDPEFIVAACDPNILWISNVDPALLSFGGERRGRDGIRSDFR